MGEITQAFVKQWDDTIRLQAQQKESRLEATVTDKGDITGAAFTANRIAPLEDTPQNNVRHGDTNWSQPNHSTREASMADFYQALPVDRADEPKVLANPNGAYLQSLMAAWNRRKDGIIYQSLLGGSRSKGDYNTTVSDTIVTLPNTQIIVDGGVGMTKAKIIAARKLFRKNEVDNHNGEELFILYTSDMLEDILADTTMTSADWMAVKAFQEGDIAGKWCGFTWVPYENLNAVGNIVSTAAYTKTALLRGTGFVEGKSQRRGDKKDTMQVSMAGSYGAVRVEEEKVVQVNFAI